MKRRNLQRVEKVCFFKKSACSQSLSPLGHSDGFASCKAWCVLISASLPKTPFPRERLCMLCWLCIVQSLWAYTPGIRAGAECGAAALTPLGATPQTPYYLKYRLVNSLQIYFFRLFSFSLLTNRPCQYILYI